MWTQQVTHQRRTAIVELHHQWLSPADIAEKLGVHIETVYRALRAAELQPNRTVDKVSLEMLDEDPVTKKSIVDLDLRSTPAEDIATKVGVPMVTVHRVLVAAGLRRSPADPQAITEIAAMRQARARRSDIAARVGLSIDDVESVLRGVGLAGTLNPHLDEKEQARIIALHREDLYPEEIAARLGRSRSGIYKVLVRAGHTPRKKPVRVGFPVAEIVEMREAGMTYLQIAQNAELDHRTVYEKLKVAGMVTAHGDHRAPTVITDEIKESILKLRDQRLTQGAIAAQLDLPIGPVSQVLRAARRNRRPKGTYDPEVMDAVLKLHKENLKLADIGAKLGFSPTKAHKILLSAKAAARRADAALASGA